MRKLILFLVIFAAVLFLSGFVIIGGAIKAGVLFGIVVIAFASTLVWLMRAVVKLFTEYGFMVDER